MHKVEFENVTLWHGDCLDVLPLLTETVDMVATDLPYGVTACAWDSVIPYDKLWMEYKRLCDGAIVLTASQPFTSALVMSNIRDFKYEWIWQKDKPSNFALANIQPMKYHENVLVFYSKPPIFNKQMQKREGSGAARYKYIVDNSHRNSEHNTIVDTPKMYDPESKNPGSVLKFSTGRRQEIIHPTQKPVALFEYLICTYTNKGDTVLDNCMGSGTTGIACIRSGRKFIGIEKDAAHFATACKRIEQELRQGQLAL